MDSFIVLIAVTVIPCIGASWYYQFKSMGHLSDLGKEEAIGVFLSYIFADEKYFNATGKTLRKLAFRWGGTGIGLFFFWVIVLIAFIQLGGLTGR